MFKIYKDNYTPLWCAKKIKDISEVIKISRKVSCSGRDSSGYRTDGKTFILSKRGMKGPLLGLRQGSPGSCRIPYSRPSSGSPSTTGQTMTRQERGNNLYWKLF